ncbi:uncharacterized protein [Musca autumnalis]|uniref:uncharacterized protein n=1 Tax=Musca autumnalis TaxID=221902 RepID=UPI003CF5E1AD
MVDNSEYPVTDDNNDGEKDFSLLTCRICLQSEQNQEENETSHMYPIFQSPSNDKTTDDMSICDKIQKCTGIQLRNHHKLPSKMCKNCFIFLNIANIFASICHNSQKYLEEYVLEKLTDDNEINCDISVDRVEILQENQLDDLPDKTKDNSSSLEYNEVEDEHSSDPCNLQKQLTNHKENFQISKTCTKESFTQDSIPQSKPRVVKEVIINTITNIPSKILGISSDGAAIIEDKTKKNNVRSNGKIAKQSNVCETCGNVYGRRFELLAHIRRHHDVKTFECELCGQAFHSNFELSRHIRKHTGSRPYECKYCKRTFSDSSSLRKHERIHRNERPYSCKTCGKTFTYASVLKVHQLTHTGEKPFNCELCGRRFSRSHHLRAHLETLYHLNDPRSKILVKRIRRAENGDHNDEPTPPTTSSLNSTV